jgi:hypothetical protein
VRLGEKGLGARQGGATASEGRPDRRVKKQGRELGHWKEEEMGKEVLTRGATLPERERRESGRSGGRAEEGSGPGVVGPRGEERGEWRGLLGSFLFFFFSFPFPHSTIQTILFEFK